MIILIPSYEPNEQLPALVGRLVHALSERGDSMSRVLVVDDGSGAGFAPLFAECSRAGADVVAHSENRGKGAALKTGFRRVLERYPGHEVVTADGDGQHAVADILAVADRVGAERQKRPQTIVLGCRDFSGEVPFRSRFGNMASRGLFRLAAGWSLSDTQTGLRGFPPEALRWLLTVKGDRFEYEQRTLLELRGAGLRAEEVPIRTVYLDDNASSHFRPLLDSIRVLAPVLAFAASSFASFLVDAAALFVFDALTGMLTLSIVLARLLSSSVNFWVNRRVVFLHRGRDGAARQAVSYALLAGVLLLSNIAWMSYLTGIGVPLLAAKIITELVLFIMSYRVQRRTVFRTEPEASVQIPHKNGLDVPDLLVITGTTDPVRTLDTQTRNRDFRSES
ncbi:hypothetical protein BMH32_12150 [Leucobacter sp. OLJS4]|uniref:bifunctional glycosyltransferase family 2/GtrA family protein n=1 Tax=unclassified Leucobacter TaxID=2621730 RepID=UPI000C180A04|nr:MULTISPECIES: bifunctional glycosyltransferase family 2/GtrA family protein [unclassified Leucobacter]PIJ49934.1 hypothetical protein BMH30_04225 [Leucobacter sp. OLES1]PII87872.1 hypothetical protein BMH25_00270 [Leucobacter sp. OLCALW19]PII92856.1 hypothetical protein BMH27_04550 [Leucobacter sp. OLAS13]PII96361.1 hypothetical protein BMH26_00580 [Leucobacter sp. OLTLW20]PII97577.1 hypothetical protein BMH28_13990 [Leucobacter sp. OLCS4]